MTSDDATQPPEAELLAELFEQFLKTHARHSNVELGKLLGVTEAYARRLRGGWRPGRVREDLRARLVASYRPPVQPSGRVREAAVSFGGEYEKGLQAGEALALREMMRWIIQRQAELGRRAGLPEVTPPSPSVDAVEETAAALAQLPPPATPAKEKRRRA